MKIFLSGTEAREALARGAEKLAGAVSSTIGPYGQNWFIEKGNKVSNDGVSIAREIFLKDEFENRGVVALREAAIKTNDEAGDGTSTATLLAWHIYKACSKFLAKVGVMAKKTPSELIRQIEDERAEVTAKLVSMATPIETKEQLINSATVSVEDAILGNLIGEAQWTLGKEGRLLAEETAEKTHSVERVNGVLIDNGFGTSGVMNNFEKQSLEVEDVAVVLTSYSIKDINDWQKVMALCETVVKTGQTKVVIIARAWTDETIRFCLANINNKQGGMKIYPLNAPYVDMTARMKDLESVLGARFIDSEVDSLDEMYISDVGFAKKITAQRFEAIITGITDDKSKKRIAKRVEELKAQLKGSVSDFEKKNLSARISQLENGFAKVKVGSDSEMERKRLFDKVEDAVNAVRAAYQEGTVPGAGLAFKQIAETLPDTYLLKQPLMELNRQIMSSAPADFVVEDWVRDPVKVLRIALEKACVAAAAFATAAGVVCEERPKQIDEMLKLRGGQTNNE